MNLKLFELRDRSTFIPIFAFRCRPASYAEGGADKDTPPDFPSFQRSAAERYLLRRCGYIEGDQVMLGRLDAEDARFSQCCCDPYGHGDSRTFTAAHEYIEAHWDELVSGAVIDVEFILKETAVAKVSERMQYPET